MARIAYFDCPSGAAGDMIMGALVDAGAPFEALRDGLHGLDLTGWDLVRSQLHLREGAPVASRDVVRSARVGITQSLTSEKPWRFAVRGSRGVTR